MTVITCSDQSECLKALAMLDINPESLRPKPPATVSDGITELMPNHWLVITSTCTGQFRLYALLDASKEEAWDFHRNLRPPGVDAVNPRLVLVKHEGEETPSNN